MDINSPDVVKIKKKRGRKSKKELALLKKLEKENQIKQEVKVPKKRGRKPKGGKIIKQTNKIISSSTNVKENVILHLKCKTDDLLQSDNLITSLAYQPNVNKVQPYNTNDSDMNLLTSIEPENTNTKAETEIDYNDSKQTIELTVSSDTKQKKQRTTRSANSQKEKDIWKKVKDLNTKLHNNNISNKESCCFWCSCNFTTPPIYIPKAQINETYEVYGSFCIPECAVGFLFKEHIDNTTRWERYAMFNSIYSSIFKYKKNIKPAPEPYYILDKFYGTLTIDEYRTLMRKDKLLMVVDKPLTRILPELYDDNNEFNINTSSLQSGSGKNTYKLSRAKKKKTKHDVNFFNT